jgi:hypothetical protein
MTLTRKKPMQRSAFSRKDSPFGPTSAKTQMRRSGIKARAKKPTVADGSKYLAACRGEVCYLSVDGFCGDWADETVVPCHSNQSIHGKGMSIKADHMFTVPGCAKCHQWLDQSDASRALKALVWNGAFERWEPVRARKMGIETNQLEIV